MSIMKWDPLKDLFFMEKHIDKLINNSFKENKRFTFDLRGVIENKTTGRTRTVIITDCKINKFSPLAVDITKVLNDTFTFSYNPENCDII